jgi:diguanylate cyclase (GGDEF)-like protein
MMGLGNMDVQHSFPAHRETEARWQHSPSTSNGSQNDHLQTLTEISRVVSATLDLRTLYDTIYQQIGRVTDTTVFYLALHQPYRNIIELPYFREEGKLFLDQALPYGNSTTSLVIERGRPLLFHTLSAYQRYAERNGLPEILVGDPAKEPSQSQIFVPLNTGSRTIGALSVQSKHAHIYTEDDVQMLSVIASQAAIAIENARLFADQQNRVFELQTIQSIVQKLNPLHDIPAIAALIDQELKQLIDYHTCRLFQLDPHGQELLPIVFPGSDSAELRFKVGEGITGWIAFNGRSEIVPNTLVDPRVSQIAGTPRREESIVGAPLIYEGRVRGVITLSKLGTNQFDENSLRLLEIIAAQAAIAFDRARLYEELRAEAITDPLTKLHNRRYLLERFREEKARALRNQHTLAAMMLDIDKFKPVNDTFGHDAGDVVLQDLASVIRMVVRAEDIVTRYGGEEFCILLPEIPAEQAERVAERLRAVIERHHLPQAAGVQSITVSVGMSLLSPDDVGVELFTRSDLAMYAVKHVGGNRSCICEGDRFRFLGADNYR